MNQFALFLAILAALATLPSHRLLAANHGFISKYEGAQTCLRCHESMGPDFMATLHWTWVHQEDGASLGKKNVINNYCIALASNEPRCTSCHAGVGWRDNSFDFTDSSKIDCLVCHDGTGTYQKTPTGAGAPDPTLNLATIAKSVGNPPTRVACGACHFYGGGGDAVKHGTMDSSLAAPSREVDVHMSAEGGNLTCVSCHKVGTSATHEIVGSRYSKDTTDDQLCQSCHTAEPHASSRLNSHATRVACQTCHIPAMARGHTATKMWWDWTTAGDKNPDGTDKVIRDDDGNEIYNTKKGSFLWERNVIPDYLWFNGQVDYVTLDDPVSPGQVVAINQLHGDIQDPGARIMPVKRFRGRQPYDSGSNTLAAPHLFPYDAQDTTALWKSYDWVSALTEGQAAVGRQFVGPVGWIETEMFWIQNHMVAPKEQALTCADCHTPRGRLDFLALGYAPDEATRLQQLFGFEIGNVDVVTSATDLAIHWLGSPGSIYQLQISDNLNAWTDAAAGQFTVDTEASPTELNWVEPKPSGPRFYRLVRTRL